MKDFRRLLLQTGLLSGKNFVIPIYSNPNIFFTQHNFFRDYALGEKEPDSIFKIKSILWSTDNWYSEDTLYRRDQKELIIEGYKKFVKNYPNTSVYFLIPDKKYVSDWVNSVLSIKQIFIFNRNAMIDPKSYTVDNSIKKKYAAVYNANFYRYKNHNLLPDDIKTCLIYYMRDQNNKNRYIGLQDQKYAEDQLKRFKSSINITLANEDNKDRRYKFLDNKELTKYYNESKVGLCLSKVEGMCMVSMEYLLSGIPVVNVKNNGGRDRFFDEWNSITVDPDKEQIRNAIIELSNRNIDSDFIRNRVISEITLEYQRFNEAFKYDPIFQNVDIPKLRKNMIEGLKYYTL